MIRVQRQRTKGWRMPPNTVYVGRPTRWGNPYHIGRSDFPRMTTHLDRQGALDAYRIWIGARLDEDPAFLEPLRGKDLACWCSLAELCHADVDLELVA